MELNKVEKQIREQLNSREINPSASSWDRLDAMLSVAENEKPKRNFRWLFIAAGIIGFVLTGLFFMNQKDTNSEINTNQTVVQGDVEVNTVKENDVVKARFRTEEIQTVQNKSGIKNSDVAVTAISKKEILKIKKEQGSISSSVKSETINQVSIAEVIPQKIEEKQKETNNNSTFLAVSDSNPSEKTSPKKPKLKINANALLSQVDGEIELTFRQKTIKTITKKFESAREAIVSRNQE